MQNFNSTIFLIEESKENKNVENNNISINTTLEIRKENLNDLNKNKSFIDLDNITSKLEEKKEDFKKKISNLMPKGKVKI